MKSIVIGGKNMHTRTDYLEGRCSHREYYAQFVVASVVARVLRNIGLAALRASTDEHFNDIPLAKWDAILFPFPSYLGDMMRERGDYPTMAGAVSICKEAARMLMDAEQIGA
jgi:hypothetical protein